MDIPDTLIDLYRFPGYEPRTRLAADGDDPDGVIVTLDRRPQKDTAASAVNPRSSSTTPAGGPSATSPPATATSHFASRFIVWSVTGAAA
jgi:hypothetical protein